MQSENHSKEKKEYFAGHKKLDVCGSRERPESHIYQLDNKSGVMVREAYFDSGKGGAEIGILQMTDLHLHAINRRDEQEENPSVFGSLQHRMAFRNASTLPNLKRVLGLLEGFDQVVVTGDAIDYLTWGSLELAEKYVWERIPDVFVTVGGHELTRVMEGDVPDPTTLESRYEILRGYWRHDMYYSSKILGDKVLLVQMHNGEGRYFDCQCEPFRRDIERARRERLVLLLFQHEPVCTRNPAEKEAVPLRVNDGAGSRDFCNGFIGAGECDRATAEVCRLIAESADVVKGIFCGHWHSDFYTELIASGLWNGQRREAVIPQYVLTGNMYDNGHVMAITVR